jgi:FkbM family methyltransferase
VKTCLYDASLQVRSVHSIVQFLNALTSARRCKLLFSFFRNRARRKHPILHLEGTGARQLKTLVHVGAHLAQERTLYERMGFGDILWIEGSPDIYQRLAESFSGTAANSVARHRTLCALLSEESGRDVSFYQFNNEGASNSLFPATQRLHDRWPHVQQTAEVQQLTTLTLDEAVASQGLAGSVNVLVVDVQGAELLVLKGGIRTLSEVDAVVCEVSTEPFYDGGVLYPELKSFLNANGFNPSMEPPKAHCDLLFRRAA